MHYFPAPAKLKLSPRMYDGLSFSRGQKFKVKVAVVGKPFPKVTWIKDGETLEHGGRYLTCTYSFIKKLCNILMIDSKEGMQNSIKFSPSLPQTKNKKLSWCHLAAVNINYHVIATKLENCFN